MPTLTSWATYNSNNQFVTTNFLAGGGVGYDAAGDVTYDGYHQYLYDGDGRVCAVRIGGSGMMTGYLYDADGSRIAKGTISQWSCDPSVNGFAVTTDYVLGLGGEQVTEMQGGVWQHTNVFAAGKLMATYDGQGLHFYLDDPLGTRRAQTNYAGVLEQTCSSLPFGDELSCTGSTTSPTEHHFTGKERDAESGLDYFGARYYGSNMGRFSSPDDGTDVNLNNPQSLNRYSYVHNNPLINTDPFGHSTHTAANGDVLAVYDDDDLSVYRHGDIDNRADWDGSHLDLSDPQTNSMGQTRFWDDLQSWTRIPTVSMEVRRVLVFISEST